MELNINAQKADQTPKVDLTPKLRFPGYTYAWELRSLGKIGKAQSGIGFPDAEQGGNSGIPFYKISDMNTPGNEIKMEVSNNYVTENQIEKKK